MNIKIPIVVDIKGRMSSAYFRNEFGEELQDTSLCWDDLPNDVDTKVIYINVELDLDEIFKSDTIKGQMSID